LNVNPTGGFTSLSSGTLIGGTYIVQGASTLNFSSGTVATIGSSATVTLDGLGSVFTPLNPFTTNAGTFNLLNGRNFTVSGGALTNTGTLQIGAVSTLTGVVNVTGGGKLYGGGAIAGNVSVLGSGSALQGGTVPGNLTVGGALTVSGGATFAPRLNGPAFGAQYDRVTVTGAANAVSLSGSVLSASLGYDPAPSDRLFILDNQTAGLVGGTFAGLPQASSFMLTNPTSGNSFTAYIYYGGDVASNSLLGGNDVVVAFSPVPEPAYPIGVAVALAGLVGWASRRASRVPGRRPQPFDSPACGTKHYLGHGRKLPQSATSEGVAS
jgi:hypothetical protein